MKRPVYFAHVAWVTSLFMASLIGSPSRASATPMTLRHAPVLAAQQAVSSCRALEYTEAVTRMIATYWVAAGVSVSAARDVVDAIGDMRDLECRGYVSEPTRLALDESIQSAISRVRSEYGRASGVWEESEFWRAARASLASAARLCGGGGSAEGIVGYLSGTSVAPIDVFGRAAPRGRGVSPAIGSSSPFYTGTPVPCSGGGGGSGTSSGGSGGDYDGPLYHPWTPSRDGGLGGCFKSNAGDANCGWNPWAHDPPFKDPTGEEVEAALVFAVEVFVAALLCPETAGATCAVAIGLLAYKFGKNAKKRMDERDGRHLCPAIRTSSPVAFASPTGNGPLSEADAMIACERKCASGDTSPRCLDLTKRLSCNASPIASSGYPMDVCVETLADDNPFANFAKLEVELCGRMSCPNNGWGSMGPDGRCECTASVGSAPLPPSECHRLMCDPLSNRCVWGC